MRMPLIAAIVSLAGTAAAASESFRAWRGMCADDGVCILTSQAEPGGADATLALRRLPGAGSPWQIVLTPASPPASLADTIAFQVDGGPKLTFNPAYDYRTFSGPDYLFLINPGLAGRLLAAMAGGRVMDLFYEPAGGGSARARFALPGLADGLAWIDARQERADRDRSVAAPGDLVPDLSMADVRSPVDGGAGERGLPGRLVEQHYLATGCERLDGPLLAGVAVVSGRLSDSALLFAVPCVAAGDTVSYRLYVVETGEIGGIQALSFAAFSPSHGWIGTDTLANVTFDERGGILTSLRSGRDEDGCGRRGEWRWEGWRFALVEYRFRAACSGAAPSAWPVVFRLGAR